MRPYSRFQRLAQEGTPWQRAAFRAARGCQLRSSLRRRKAVASQIVDEKWFDLPYSEGYRLFSPGELPDLNDVLAYSRRVLEESVDGQQAAHKLFVRMDYLDAVQWTLDHPILSWALQPGLIAAVADYLGMVPLLKSVSIWSSQFSPRSLESSQLFHCDGDESTQVKVFVYLSDVDQHAGPLTLLNAADSARAKERLHYRYDKQSYRVPDDAMDTIVNPERRVECVGPTGTVVVADTSHCFHFGSRVARAAQRRDVLILQYITPLAFNLPWRFDDACPFRNLDEARLSEAQRLTLCDHRSL